VIFAKNTADAPVGLTYGSVAAAPTTTLTPAANGVDSRTISSPRRANAAARQVTAAAIA
jgi:hypothetical protein